MSERMLQVNFNFSVSAEDYENLVSTMAEQFAKVDGLRWKIWILNKDNSEAGAFYMFESQSAVDAFLNGPLVAQISSHPAVSNLSAKSFEIMKEVTAVTRGPI
jgi:hypothetical protein